MHVPFDIQMFWDFLVNFSVMTWLTPAFHDQIWLTSRLSSRQVIFIYLSLFPLVLSCSLFFSHLLEEFLEIVGLQYWTVILLHTEIRISHVTSTAQLCNWNSLTFKTDEYWLCTGWKSISYLLVRKKDKGPYLNSLMPQVHYKACPSQLCYLNDA